MSYAVVSSATIGQAMETVARFTPMRNRLFDYRCSSSHSATVLTVSPRLPLAGYRTFLEMGTLFAIFKIVQALAGDTAVEAMELDVTWRDRVGPPGLPPSIRYSQPVSALKMPTAVAGKRALTADANLYASAVRSCEEELAALAGSVAAKVRSLLPRGAQGWPTLNEVASDLAMSRSTLIRRLADEGLAYQDLLDEARRELACFYLCKTALPLDSIAERLGYADASTFSRNFRRWQGTAPLAFRKSRPPLG